MLNRGEGAGLEKILNRGKGAGLKKIMLNRGAGKDLQ